MRTELMKKDELSWSFLLFCFCFSFSLVTGLAVSASAAASISDEKFVGSRDRIGRSLLQAKKECPVSFEFLNYTVITGQCKGPEFPPKRCCEALKEFACPYADELNDLTNNCAQTMFSYINLNGKYPPGVFAHECKEGKRGLECPAASTQSANNKADASHTLHIPTTLFFLGNALILLL